MTVRRPLTASADPLRDVPSSSSGRHDRIRIALRSLHEEEHRLARLGLEHALRRCREQRRYWEFLAALFSIAEPDGAEVSERGYSWDSDPNR